MIDNENIEVISENDQPIYAVSLDECRKKGLLHRSVAIFLQNTNKEILLEQGSLKDEWLPGKLTLSSTVHVRVNELPSPASIRELKEELGIDALPNFL